MKVLGTFNAPQLCMVAHTTPSNARFYLRALQGSGFVRKIRQAKSGVAGSFDTWSLVRDTGPDAPIWRKDKTVYDPNTNITYKLACHDEAAS